MMILALCCMVAACILSGMDAANMRKRNRDAMHMKKLLDDTNAALDKLNAWSVEYETDLNAKVMKLTSRQEDMRLWMQLTGNRLQLLEEAQEVPKEESAGEDTNVPTTEPKVPDVENMTRNQLKAVLDQMGVPYSQKDNKAQLIALIKDRS